MVQLSIPREYQRGFAELRKLKEDQVEGLVSTLEEEQPTLNRTDLRERVASRVESIGRTQLNAIMDALISLFALRDDLRLDTPEFVSTISDAMAQSGADNLAFSDEENRASFEAVLTRLLEIDALEVAAKAISLSYTQEHTIHGNPRVLTDIRPIFSSEPTEVSLRGAMVIHTLKLEYHEARQTKELFVSLSAEQVDELIEVLERAKSKAETLKQTLQESHIRYVEAE